MDYFNPAEAFKAGYAATEAVSTDIQSKDILREAYAGQPPGGEANTGNPATDTEVYAKAARLAGMQGNASLAHSFTKQATDSAALTGEMKLNQVKAAQASLGMASQYAEAATSQEDLYKAIDMSGADEQTRMYLRGAIRTMPLDQAKATLKKVSMTVEQNLKAEQLAITGASQRTSQDNIETDNLRARLNLKTQQGLEFTPEEQAFIDTGVLPKYQGKKTTTGAEGAAPKSVRLNNPLNLTDPKTGEIRQFDTVEEGIAAGKADLAGKLAGTSAAYKSKFGDKPVTPERLAETWAPAAAKGNSPESTANYAKAIAKAAGVEVGQTIPNTPEVQDKVFNAMAAFEAGPGSGAKAAVAKPEEPAKQEVEAKWDKLNPVFKEKNKLGDVEALGVAFGVEPKDFVGLSQKKKDFLNNSYAAADKSEKVAQLIAKSPDAVGTLAAIYRKAGGASLQLLDNIASDKTGKYTSEVAVLAKELFAMGLDDAQTGAAGRMNVFLEKEFAKIYDPALSATTLLDVLKSREKNSINNITRTIRKADASNLDKEEFSLYNSNSGSDYLKEKSGKGATSKPTIKPTQSIGSFFRSPVQTQAE